MEVAGEGRRKILVVGEAPGETEDLKGLPFVGKAGRELQSSVRSFGADLFRDCWVTNALICRPPENRTPTDKEVDYCRPNVVNTIMELKPKVVVLLGGTAINSVVSWLWGDRPETVKRWVGFQIPAQEINAWVCPTYHPSFVLREEEKSVVPRLLFREHLRRAFAHAKRPWRSKPDFARRVESVVDERLAAQRLRRLLRAGAVTFDYETNMLKPDSSRSAIACCAVSDGKTSLAFPWRGEPVELMRRLLSDGRVKKIAANMRFEDGWTFKEFGFFVKGWKFDMVLGAHALDNRKLISGLKFQAFVRLGQRRYDRHVEPFLKTKVNVGYKPNRVFQCPIKDLLHYCGMDALLEYHLAKIQLRDF